MPSLAAIREKPLVHTSHLAVMLPKLSETTRKLYQKLTKSHKNARLLTEGNLNTHSSCKSGGFMTCLMGDWMWFCPPDVRQNQPPVSHQTGHKSSDLPSLFMLKSFTVCYNWIPKYVNCIHMHSVRSVSLTLALSFSTYKNMLWNAVSQKVLNKVTDAKKQFLKI